MRNLSYTDKIVNSLKKTTFIDDEEIRSIRRVLKLSEGKVLDSDNDSFTIEKFIEKSLEYFCMEYMTICRSPDEMADIMTLKRHLDNIKDGLIIDESVVDRFVSLYL